MIGRSAMPKQLQSGLGTSESPAEEAADKRSGTKEGSRKDTAMDTKQERGRRTGGEGGSAGPMERAGTVANKAPGSIKASPRKKLAMGAKGVVKGK